jgi:hypothetical protein
VFLSLPRKCIRPAVWQGIPIVRICVGRKSPSFVMTHECWVALGNAGCSCLVPPTVGRTLYLYSTPLSCVDFLVCSNILGFIWVMWGSRVKGSFYIVLYIGFCNNWRTHLHKIRWQPFCFFGVLVVISSMTDWPPSESNHAKTSRDWNPKTNKILKKQLKIEILIISKCRYSGKLPNF